MSRMLLKPSFLSSSLSSMRTLIFKLCHIHTQISTPPNNQLIFNYLTNTLNFPKPKALNISNRLFTYNKSLETVEKPQNVVNYFQSLGFSNTQIQIIITGYPQILFAHVQNTLKPKIKLFQDFDISGVQLVNDVLDFGNCKENDDLCKVLTRLGWLPATEKVLLGNILYLKSCGIDESQLSKLLVRQPRIFFLSESKIKDLVDKVVDMGFSFNSKMFYHALHSISCISKETFVKKIGIFKESGFSETECMHMFKTTPTLLRVSEDKLRVGLKFFLETVGAKRSMIVSLPVSLKFSMQNRVIPRYRVVQVLKEKGIMKKELKSLSLFYVSEKNFLMSYIWKYPDHAEELLITYKGHPVDSSEE